MFLVTDFVLYKPIVMLDAISSIVMFLLVLEPVTLFKTQVSFNLQMFRYRIGYEWIFNVNYCKSTRSYSVKCYVKC